MASQIPRTIVFAASKGGCGKSTICAALAVQAVKEGSRVALIDAEPQKSLTLWWSLRGKPGNPFMSPYDSEPMIEADAFKAEGYQWVFVDTVPAMMDHINTAVAGADFVVIPTRVSAFDLAATRVVVGACRLHAKPFCFVLNATDPKWKAGIASAITQLKKLGPVVSKTIRQRTVYASALMAGKTGPEARDAKEAKAAADEVRAVWAAIQKMAAGKVGASR